jgi:hypothetical protein
MVAGIIGGAGLLGSIGSAVIGSNAATSAANAQVQAAQIASNTQLGIFNQTQKNLAPYNTAGQSALSQLAALFGLNAGGTGPSQATAGAATSALQNYPGYQFGLQQGNLAQQQSAASSGLLLSGAQLQASQQFGQNYAMQNAWNPYVSTLQSIGNLGENAAATTGQIGATTGQGVAQTQLAAGQAQASGIVGSANAINTGIYSGLNNALLGYSLSNPNPQTAQNTSGLSPAAQYSQPTYS